MRQTEPPTSGNKRRVSMADRLGYRHRMAGKVL
jgi:hypothetical protein